jgi:hypothetical protein
VKYSKWHTIVFRCPKCSATSDYALEIVDGPCKGSIFKPTYYCEKCETIARVQDPWLFGAVYGPTMAMFAAFAVGALPVSLEFPQWVNLAFAASCSVIVGWPFSRYLSRHLVSWERSDRAPQR